VCSGRIETRAKSLPMPPFTLVTRSPALPQWPAVPIEWRVRCRRERRRRRCASSVTNRPRVSPRTQPSHSQA
jgi:hypothetical protein